MRLVSFFFQAEDGIRDYKVTGVQTCALPIYSSRLVPGIARRLMVAVPSLNGGRKLVPRKRSEERRVGKECGSRGAPSHEKNNARAGTDVGVRARWKEQCKRVVDARSAGVERG